MIEVYKATSAYGSSCHFGVESAARAWAGTNGTVERIELRDPPVLTVVQADDSPRWPKLDAQHEMARQFVCHPVSRGISDCEEAGELMTDAAAEIERLCRVRNCLSGSARQRNLDAAALRAENERLRADADRYQWLRNEAVRFTPPDKDSPWVVLGAGPHNREPCEGRELDAAIDAARGAKGDADGPG